MLSRYSKILFKKEKTEQKNWCGRPPPSNPAHRDGNGVNIMTSEISSRPAVFRLAHQRGEKLVLCVWYFITKITHTGRKPSPGEFVMIIRLGNISGLGTSPLSSPAWQSFTFLTEVEIDQTLAGWCDGVLVLTVTTHHLPHPHQAPLLHRAQLSLYLWRNQGNKTAVTTPTTSLVLTTARSADYRLQSYTTLVIVIG